MANAGLTSGTNLSPLFSLGDIISNLFGSPNGYNQGAINASNPNKTSIGPVTSTDNPVLDAFGAMLTGNGYSPSTGITSGGNGIIPISGINTSGITTGISNGVKNATNGISTGLSNIGTSLETGLSQGIAAAGTNLWNTVKGTLQNYTIEIGIVLVVLLVLNDLIRGDK